MPWSSASFANRRNLGDVLGVFANGGGGYIPMVLEVVLTKNAREDHGTTIGAESVLIKLAEPREYQVRGGLEIWLIEWRICGLQ
jgi:hypothetical protein